MTANIKLKSPVVFPANVSGAGGIKVSKDNGAYTIQPDFSALGTFLPGDLTDPTSKQVWVYDPVQGTYSVMTLANLGDALYSATSTTSLAIETGSKVFTTQSGKGFSVGSFVLATSDADATNYMLGQVTAYSGTSLTLNVVQIGGSGTHADWTLRISAAQNASDATLNSIADLGTAADKMIYTTGVDTWAETPLTSTARSLLDDASTSDMRTTLAVVGTADTDVSGNSWVLDEDSMASDSATKVPTQQSVKAYVDQITAANDAMVFKGAQDCSANPNYPAANRGWTYRVSVAGKIGGASGVVVEAGDLFMCLTDGTAAGDQATVGTNWTVAQTNIDGAVVGPASATGDNIATFNGATGKLIKDSGKALPSGSIVGTSDTQALDHKDLSAATNTFPALLADILGITFAQGDILYYDGTNIVNLGPGTSGDFLKTQGAGANPVWANIPGGGDMLSTNNLSDVADAATALANLDPYLHSNIPQVSKSTAYTTVLTDGEKHILHPSADTTARTFTIDSNANVAHPVGTAITFVNQNSAGVVTIAITSDTMRLAGAGTTGSRTLAANGIATALKIASTEWIISGTGLT